MEHVDKYDELVNLLTEEVIINGKPYLAKDEFEKFFVKGNKTSGTRLRKIMQMVKGISQEVREDVRSHKKELEL
jgi:hypothetical protein